MAPDFARGEVTVFVGIWGQANFRELEVIALDGEKEAAKGTAFYHYEKGGYEITLKIPAPIAWSQESPKLYGLRIRLANEDGTTHDGIISYFALRDASVIHDATGRARPALNGKPLFLLGVEEAHDVLPGNDTDIQGWIETTQAMGFNCVLVGGGLASPRFYHWADRLGLMIWQDNPVPDAPVVKAPVANSGEPKPVPEPISEQTASNRFEFQSHPSIVAWSRDPANLDEMAGAWLSVAHAGTGSAPASDLIFVNGHPGAAMPYIEGESKAALAVCKLDFQAGSLTRAAYESNHEDIRRLIHVGLGAAVFSRRPDPALGLEWLAAINDKTIHAESSIATPHTVLQPGGKWNYTTAAPPEGWENPSFDDSGWKAGAAPFGDPKAEVQTAWTSDHLWMRQSFPLDGTVVDHLFLKIFNRNPAKIYLNGKLIADCSGASSAFRVEPLPAEAASLLVDGTNTVAIEIVHEGKLHFIDAGLIDFRQ